MANVVVKSYSSFAVNEGLLAKVVDAVVAGERDARRYGKLKSFEIFYHGHRVNLVLGRIIIIPAKVADSIEDFPTALLYGTMVKELSGETISDIFTHKMGESEFDEYTDKDLKAIKETLFKDEDGTYRSIVMFVPTWAGSRDYVTFKMTHDEERLCMLLRHLVFAAYFNPALSSAFEQLSTDLLTERTDVTDVTPKLNFPFLAENLLKQYPDLQPGDKTASVHLPKMFMTAANVDDIKTELLDPGELAVLNELTEEITAKVDGEISTAEEIAGTTKVAGEYDPRTMYPDGACRGCNGQGKFRQTEPNSSIPQTCNVCHGTGGTVPRAKADGSKQASDSEFGPDADSPAEDPFSGVIPSTAHRENMIRDWVTAHDGEVPDALFLDAKNGLVSTAPPSHVHYYRYPQRRIAEIMDAGKPKLAAVYGAGEECPQCMATMPHPGDSTCPAAKGEKKEFPAPEKADDLLKKDASVDDKGATTGLRNRPDYGEDDSYTSVANRMAEKGASFKTAGAMTWGVYQDGGGFQWSVFEGGMGKPKVVAKGTAPTQGQADAAIEAAVHKGQLPPQPFNNRLARAKQASSKSIMERSGSQLIRTGSVLTAKSPTGYTETIRVNGTKIKWAMPNRFSIAFRQTAETLIRNPRFASTLKVADVPQTFEDIWGEKMEDLGPAPEVELKAGPLTQAAPPSSEAPAEHTAPAATEEKAAPEAKPATEEKKDPGTGDDDPKPPTDGGKPAEKADEGGKEKEKEEGWQKPWEKEAGSKTAAPMPSPDTVARVRTLYTSGIGQESLKNDFQIDDATLHAILRGDFGKGSHKTAADARLPDNHPMQNVVEPEPEAPKVAALARALGACDFCTRSVTASTGSEVGPDFFLHAACQVKGRKLAQNGLVAYQVLAHYYPDVLRKVASGEFIDAAIQELREKGELQSHSLELPEMAPNEQQAVFELARRLELQDEGRHLAAFDLFIPGQVAQEFAPDVLRETVDFPNDSYHPMITDVGPGPEGAFVSTSPAGGLGIGQDGKPQVLDGAPLRKENDIRGYMFDQEFYQQQESIDPSGIRTASCLMKLRKTADAAEFKAQFADFLKKTMGEVAASFMAAFKVTMRPMMNKVPGVGEIQLQYIEQPLQEQRNAYNIPNIASRVRFLVSKLNDSDIQDAINAGWAQASVSNDSEDGGFVYEIFVRPSALDVETLEHGLLHNGLVAW